jgi:hypothetical protein
MKGKHWLALSLAGLVFVAWPATVLAHSGSPYPVLLEERVGPYITSALADPDVGTGTFYVQATMPDETPAPPDTVVTIWSKPQDGHASEAAYQAERQQTRYGERFVAKVPFDAKGPWQVRLTIEGPAGNGETSFPIQVTPKGFQWLTTIACLVPFVILGLLWLRASRRQGEEETAQVN